MGVISVRLNKEEEKILKVLSENLGVDKSTLIKKSMFKLYENMVDMDILDNRQILPSRPQRTPLVLSRSSFVSSAASKTMSSRVLRPGNGWVFVHGWNRWGKGRSHIL